MDKNLVNELAQAWVEGDMKAFSKLYDHFVDKIYKFVFFKVPSSEAEDLTENIFVKILENANHYAVQKGSFTTWVYTIARNTVIDFYRTNKSVLTLDEAMLVQDNSQDNHSKAALVLNSVILKKSIAKLSKKYQDLVVLRFVDDMSYSEIADILNKTEGSVRVDMHRALKQLKADLGNL